MTTLQALTGLACLPLTGVLLAAAEPPPVHRDKQDLLYFAGAAGERRPVRAKRDWQKRRRQILASMELVMGPLPRMDHRLPPAIEVLREVRMPKYTWRRITYLAEPGDRVPAYLYVPHGLRRNRRAPAIVSLHGTTYRRYLPPEPGSPPPESGDTRYAHELAERGYVVIAPDYVYLSADYKTVPYDLGYASGTMKGIVNHIRAVDVLLTLPQVDSRRIGAIGLSLGGHNTLFLGVFDRRVRAMVTSAGFNSFYKYYGGDLTGWSSTRYMPRIAEVYGKDPARMPFDFTEVLAALAPRAVFVNAPLGDDNFEVSGVKDCMAAALPVFELLGARDRLFAMHPEGGHGFSPEARVAAYAFLEKWLPRR
jgi:dienelactone hydrolase